MVVVWWRKVGMLIVDKGDEVEVVEVVCVGEGGRENWPQQRVVVAVVVVVKMWAVMGP